ncbi:MAG: M28 family metallopeptidase [Candidatus Geothermincolia bacterium]
MRARFLIITVIIALLLGLIVGCGSQPAADPAVVVETEQRVDTPPPPAPAYRLFDATQAMRHIEQLSVLIGPRPEGTSSEVRGAEYIRGAFTSMGYAEVMQQTVPLPNGTTSYNVYVDSPGSDPTRVIVIGAHYDSKGGTGSPGANDNASGTAAVLELARVFKTNPHIPTLRFVAFGAEEVLQGYSSGNHHFGSRYMAAQLGAMPGNEIGMISLDMIGVGRDLTTGSMLVASRRFLDMFSEYLAGLGHGFSFRQDPGWSDHEAFEAVGVPSFWIAFREDPNYHTPGDTYYNINPELINVTGQLVQGFIENTGAPAWQALDAATP